MFLSLLDVKIPCSLEKFIKNDSFYVKKDMTVRLSNLRPNKL